MDLPIALDGSVRHVRGVLSMAALGCEQDFQRAFTYEADVV